MPTIVKLDDPRVKRTRQMLIEAFVELGKEKSFRAISVQDIAERATVNRATFYAHFSDKYDLLEGWVRDSFRLHLLSRISPSAPFSQAQLRLFIEAVFDHLGKTLNQCRASNREYHPLVESAIQDELYAFVLDWLKKGMLDQSPLRGTDGGVTPVSLETTATVISWAIFGAGTQLNRNRKTSIEEVAHQVMKLMTQGLNSMLPGLLRESA